MGPVYTYFHRILCELRSVLKYWGWNKWRWIEKFLTQGFEKFCFQKGESKHRPRPICHVLEGGWCYVQLKLVKSSKLPGTLPLDSRLKPMKICNCLFVCFSMSFVHNTLDNKAKKKKKLFGCPPPPAPNFWKLEKSFYCTKVYRP